MRPTDAMRLVDEDLALEGDPQRNLATFVTTWMEPEAQRIIAENLHRNFIDHAEYPISAEIEQRCVRMLADLFHAPRRDDRLPHPGLVRGDHARRPVPEVEVEGASRGRRTARPTSPNLVFGGDVHVVWEKFCRYFDVEPRIVPLAENKYTIGPDDVEPHLDENTIGVVGRPRHDVHRAHGRHRRDQPAAARRQGASAASTSRCTSTAPAAAFVWPFLYPDSKWDFRLEQVRSINVSGHKYGLVYPGIGWLVFREKSDLAQDLVFYENYLGKTDATFTLNFSTGASMVLAQYYNFVRLGRDGYTYVMKQMQQNAQRARGEPARQRPVRGDRRRPGAAAAGGVPARRATHASYDESDIAWQLSAERGWMVPAYTLPPNAENVKIMRALVKETMSREQVERLTRDIADACATLDQKGGDAPDRTRADQDGHRLLTVASATRRGRRARRAWRCPGPRGCGAGRARRRARRTGAVPGARVRG